jgi:hypothetical protein
VRQTVLGLRNNERLILPNTSSRALPSINYGLTPDELIAKMHTYTFLLLFFGNTGNNNGVAWTFMQPWY